MLMVTRGCRPEIGPGSSRGTTAGMLVAGAAPCTDTALAQTAPLQTPNTCAASASGPQLQLEHATTPPQAGKQVGAAADGSRTTLSAAAEEGSRAALRGKGESAARLNGKPPRHSGSVERASQGQDAEAAASGKSAPRTEACAPPGSSQACHQCCSSVSCNSVLWSAEGALKGGVPLDSYDTNDHCCFVWCCAVSEACLCLLAPTFKQLG